MREKTQVSPARTEMAADGERQRLMRDAVVNNIGAPVSAVIGLLLVPVMLRALGQDNYGLWIVATSMSGIVGLIDLGLGWSVCRAVAADPTGGKGDTFDIIRSAANVYVLIGIIGCVVLGGVGLLSGGSLHLPPFQRGTATLVFWLVGATLCADHVSGFGFAVLSGLRRFKLINVVATLASITWAMGAVIILMNGGNVADVAACQLIVAVLKSVGMLWLVARFSPKFRFRLGFIKWTALKRHVSFAASSMAAQTLSAIAWESAPVLIGFVSGSAAAVPFFIGQKFPLAVSGMSWRAAEVVFPAATENRHDTVASGDVLRVCSRWVLVLALPFTILFFVAAPDILHAWVGNPPPGSVMVLRILAATVLADAAAAPSLHLLWGRGAMRPILITYVAQAVGLIALILALIYPFGVAGAAWGMLIAIGAGAAIIFVTASRICDVNAWNLATDAMRGLALPVLACVISASIVINLAGDSRLCVVLGLSLGGLMYMATLFGFSGNKEEKRFAHDALSRLKDAAAFIYRDRSI